jgi:hypothetical protein
MGKSYRIKTDVGINKSLSFELDQDFEFLEILSLQIGQADVYNRDCSQYGVVVGRVVANSGLGVPNVKVTIFVPILETDAVNEEIVAVYPYVNPDDRNTDGYRFNVLPYSPSYTNHAATGTFPTRDDILKDPLVAEIYDKYYKYTVKTNESGDYMIFGVPVGVQTILMDLDLSDIGEFSLTPQDLIRMGRATAEQVAGDRFISSPDIDTLPQIVSIRKQFEVSPFWGDPSQCQAAVNRVDFDLRSEANIEISPSSVFMGSMFSTIDKYRINAPRIQTNIPPSILSSGCKPKDNFGNLCELQAGPGQILAIRQTIFQDNQGRPILEEYRLENSGNVIDENGTWLTELPMNLDYVTTAEDGTRIFSNDPSVGIPTKAKYRFKVKWQQPSSNIEQVKRPYYLLPNIREMGWVTSTGDPNYSNNPTTQRQLASSYYFGLDWTGYTQGYSGALQTRREAEIFNCEDTFYELNYNKVYTVSSLIDQYKRNLPPTFSLGVGGRGRFVGIKEIDDNDCASTVNKFPVNEGFKNFDLIYFLFSLILQLFQVIFPVVIIIYQIVNKLSQLSIGGSQLRGFGLPMLTYPECQGCSCDNNTYASTTTSNIETTFSQLPNPLYYTEGLLATNLPYQFDNQNQISEANKNAVALAFSQTIGTRTANFEVRGEVRTTESLTVGIPDYSASFNTNSLQLFSYSYDLPLAERINIFNGRKKFFDGLNKISVSFDNPSNTTVSHFDNTLTFLSEQNYPAGTLLTFVNPNNSRDPNYFYPASLGNPLLKQGITGTTKLPNGGAIQVRYATSQTAQSAPVNYFLSEGSEISNYDFPMDIEYYQVITGMTISEARQIWNSSAPIGSLPNILQSDVEVLYSSRDVIVNWRNPITNGFVANYNYEDIFNNYENQYIVILQRGVDPYSPLYKNKYGVGKLFGYTSENAITFTAETRLNVPIQSLPSGGNSVQNHKVQNNIYNSSYFFEAGTGFSSFTTYNTGYFSAIDATLDFNNYRIKNTNTSPLQPMGSVAFLFNRPTINGVTCMTSVSANNAFVGTGIGTNTPPAKYIPTDDLSGVSYYYMRDLPGNGPNDVEIEYFSLALLPEFTGTGQTSITSKVNNIMRSDRLPMSDFWTGDWTTIVPLFQQYTGFQIYEITPGSPTLTAQEYNTGASTVSPDIEDLPAQSNVVDTFDCNSMVSLYCYSGEGTTFGVSTNCGNNDYVENGCYRFGQDQGSLSDNIERDLRAFSEWSLRYRLFYALCRGILSQTFTNNWVNGSLFAFPIQIKPIYGANNQLADVLYCKDLIFYDDETNNYYFRSSPYNFSTSQFIGRTAQALTGSLNTKNLLFPTTLINLGPKSQIFAELSLNPSDSGYVVNQLTPTSYGDQSDLVNLYVISRVSSSRFFNFYLLPTYNALGSTVLANLAINSFFSRPGERVDGDLAQLMSINSEFGVIKFSPESYSNSPNDPDNPIYYLSNPSGEMTLGVFFSSSTEDLQYKDFISPGRILFRPSPTANAFPYVYGIKSQKVPFYRWKTNPPANLPNIFGSQSNNWETASTGIFADYYQNLDRTRQAQPTYFIGSNSQLNDTFARGYIWNADSNGNVSVNNGNYPSTFLVGAPNHFYFGLINGATALDRFKSFYLSDE